MRGIQIALLFALAIAAGWIGVQLLNPSARWHELNATVEKAYEEGRYEEGAPLAEQALVLARQALGSRHLKTLTSMNNLGLLYRHRQVGGLPWRARARSRTG